MSTTTPSSKSIGAGARRGRPNHERQPALPSRRTTITLSAQSQEIVERFKSSCGTSTSAAIDRIIQRSEPKPCRLREVNGFLVLDVPLDRPTSHFTPEVLKQLEDDMDRQYLERLMPRKKEPAAKKTGTRRRQ